MKVVLAVVALIVLLAAAVAVLLVIEYRRRLWYAQFHRPPHSQWFHILRSLRERDRRGGRER